MDVKASSCIFSAEHTKGAITFRVRMQQNVVTSETGFLLLSSCITALLNAIHGGPYWNGPSTDIKKLPHTAKPAIVFKYFHRFICILWSATIPSSHGNCISARLILAFFNTKTLNWLKQWWEIKLLIPKVREDKNLTQYHKRSPFQDAKQDFFVNFP